MKGKIQWILKGKFLSSKKELKEIISKDIELEKIDKNELKEVEESRKKEKKQVYINPDSLIGKEIKYQTALLHEILHELRNRG